VIKLIERGLTRIVAICDNPFNQNCFLLLQDRAASCLVVDPGYGYERIVGEIRGRGLSVERIVATHTHFDHVASVAPLQRDFGGSPFLFHPADQPTLATANTFALFLKTERISPPTLCLPFGEGDRLDFAGDAFCAFHTPGHTPGGLLFQYRDILFSGDLLLGGPPSLRRLPGLDVAQLEASRKRVLGSFPDDTCVLPGHGRPHTIGELRRRFLLGEI
jgi:hydroxyacylglutathione hydrolase